MLCHVGGGLSQSGGLEGRGVVEGDGGRGRERNTLHLELFAFLFEEGRGESRGGGGRGGGVGNGRAGLDGSAATRAAHLGRELSDLLGQAVVLGFHLREALQEELILLLHADLLGFQLLHL